MKLLLWNANNHKSTKIETYTNYNNIVKFSFKIHFISMFCLLVQKKTQKVLILVVIIHIASYCRFTATNKNPSRIVAKIVNVLQESGFYARNGSLWNWLALTHSVGDLGRLLFVSRIFFNQKELWRKRGRLP